MRCELYVVTYQNCCGFAVQRKGLQPVAGGEEGGFARAVKLDLAIVGQKAAVGSEAGGGIEKAVAVAFGVAKDQGGAVCPRGGGQATQGGAVAGQCMGRQVGAVVAGQPKLGQDQGGGTQGGGGGKGGFGLGASQVKVGCGRMSLPEGEAHDGSCPRCPGQSSPDARHGHQRRSKRRRSRIAATFITTRNTRSTMIAPFERSMKAGSERLAQE